MQDTHYIWQVSKNRSLTIDWVDLERFRGKRIYFTKGGYAYYLEKFGRRPKQRFLHREILSAPAGVIVDHVDGNILNISRSNLRLATKTENNRNRKGWSGNSVKGVEIVGKRCRAAIYADNIRYRLGSFSTLAEAAVAYDMFAELLHGRYARLNYHFRDSNHTRKQLLQDPCFRSYYQNMRAEVLPSIRYEFSETSTGILPVESIHSTTLPERNPNAHNPTLPPAESYPDSPMSQIEMAGGSSHPLQHVFWVQSPQGTRSPETGHRKVQIDTAFYTRLTDQVLDHFYPKYCCGERLNTVDGKRDTVLRCPRCHKQQTRLAGTPLNHLKVPRWMFGYLLKESEIQYPKVLTTTEIMRRVGVSSKTAMLLKRRIQLFTMDLLPRMQRKFYQDNKLMFHDFRFPRDRNVDLTEMVRDKPIPQADTVVLYSCSTAANKGRKRYKRTGQTASIYMSESLGGMQRGTLVNTIGVKKGPVFYDSVPNQKAETINPILGKYIPVHNPLFTDEGYRGYPGMNLRTVNHSRKSPDKRFKWSRNRWSRNGVHCNVAEGNNGKIKQAFSTYRWIDPKHSKLYTSEFSVLGNLRYFGLDDLLPEAIARNPSPTYKLDENWDLRGMSDGLIPDHKAPVKSRIGKNLYEAWSLIEIHRRERLTQEERVREQLNKVSDPILRRRLSREYRRYVLWSNAETTKDQRRKQRYFETIAQTAWNMVPTEGYIEIHELAQKLRKSGKHVFRLMAIWCRLGLIDTVRLTKDTKAKHTEYFDIRRQTGIFPNLVYVVPQAKLAKFNVAWRRRVRSLV